MLLEKSDVEINEKDKLIYYHTVLKNPYIPFKPYPKQAMGLILASKEEQYEDSAKKPNSILLGAGGYLRRQNISGQYVSCPILTGT